MIEGVYGHVELLVESATIIISFAGACISATHARYYSKIEGDFAKKLRDNFFWDMAIYATIFVMGIALFMDMDWLARVDIIIRPFVLLMAVIASVRLYRHYKIIQEKENL